MINQTILLAASFLFCTVTMGQTVVEPSKQGTTLTLPTFVLTQPTTTVFVPDGGKTHWDARRNRRSLTSKELLARTTLPSYLRSHVCSRTKADGKTTLDIVHEFKPLKIVVFDDGRIEITIVRHYDDSNRDDLESEHPEIAMHINAFPTNSPGNGQVQLSLDIETTVSVDSIEQLKAEHGELHNILVQYAQTDTLSIQTDTSTNHSK